jgi:hypothetical protein
MRAKRPPSFQKTKQQQQEGVMSLCYYDVLESTLLDIEQWRANSNFTKEDVLDAARKRIVMLMRHVQTTPMIGSAYAYPGDLDLSGILRLYDDGAAAAAAAASASGSA